MTTPSFMRPAFDLLVQYAREHRDRRNITTHLVGVPMVVFATGVLLSRAAVQAGGTKTTVAWLALALVSLWTLTRGQWLLGLATTAFMAALVWAAHGLAAVALLPWLVAAFGFFVLGWMIQFAGHYYEGRKLAFVDDFTGLLVGPMFVTLELLAMAGLARPLLARVEQAAGPTVLRDLAMPLGTPSTLSR